LLFHQISNCLQSRGDNATFIWCTITGQYQHIIQPTYQQPSAELCSIATDDMTLSNELQNYKSTILVVQNSTSKTAKEFEFGSLQKEFNLFETSGVRRPNLDMLFSALPYTYSQHHLFSVAGNFKTKIRSRMQFRVLNALVFLKYYFLDIF
jgi:hypothetical protein